MKYAILSDIHANLEALEMVLQDAQKEECTHYAVLGDLVGYAANPKECVSMVRELKCPVVKGNFDEYASEDDDRNDLNPVATKSIVWTRKQLDDEQRDWLRRLELVQAVESFTIVHSTLDMPHKWQYVFDKSAANCSLSHQQTKICFYGHTHQPCAFIQNTNRETTGGQFETLLLDQSKKYLINVGSVGQPRDGNPKAAYVIYDIPANKITLRRVPYDVQKTIAKIRDAGLS